MKKLFIGFSNDVSILKRNRIEYAFKVYCATRGYGVSDEYSPDGINIYYGPKPDKKFSNCIFVPELYIDYTTSHKIPKPINYLKPNIF